MILGLVTAAVLAATPAAAAPAPKAAARMKVVVMDVRATGAGDPKMVEGLSSLVASEVARRPNLAVIAGVDLRTLIGYERQRQLVGCTESSCLAELAGGLGAAYLVSTEYSRVGSTGLLSMTLLDANRALAVKRLTHRVRSDDALVDETAAAVDELLTALPGAGDAAPAAAPAAASYAPPASAVAPDLARGYHTHDGFFFALNAGVGGLRSKGDGGTVSGSSGSFELAAGGALTPSLVLYVTIFDEVDTSPTFKTDTGATVTASKVTHSLMVYAAGARYYLVPSNFYVGGAVGVGAVSLEYDVAGATRKESTSNGPVLRLAVGKEWWVSTNWGLGLSLNLTGAVNKSTSGATGASTTFTSGAVNVAFSASYN